MSRPGASAPPTRVLLVALDAAEPQRIEAGIESGELPNLRRLRDAGTYTRLGSPADVLAGSVWPTFHTGTHPGDHGIYHFVQWDPVRMTFRRPGPDRLPQPVFWRRAAAAGRKVVAIDPPCVYDPEPLNGVEISGWCTHDLLAPPASFPPDRLRRARRAFGGPPLPPEVAAPESPAGLRDLQDRLLDWTTRTRDLALSLMEEEPWDLFFVSFTATHRGGHKLWGETATRHGRPGSASAGSPATDLGKIYRAVDEAVGRLVSAAGPAEVFVFSLHGMGPNTSRVPVLGEMLARVLEEDGDRSAMSGPLATGGARATAGAFERIRALIPQSWRSRVKGRLPRPLQDRLTSFWRTSAIDFHSVRAFPAVADLQGYVRINLKGREAFGVVPPGEAYDRLCNEITEGLMSFQDRDTGEPVVRDVLRPARLYPGTAQLRELPDLVVQWNDLPASLHRELVSPRWGTVPWPTPGLHPDGRSGNHRGEGFLIGHGPRAGRVEIGESVHIVDLAPTIFSLLGLPPELHWAGRSLVPGTAT